MILGKESPRLKKCGTKKGLSWGNRGREIGVKRPQCSISRQVMDKEVKEMMFACGVLSKCVSKELVLFQWPWEGELMRNCYN